MNKNAMKQLMIVLHDCAGLDVSEAQALELYEEFDAELKKEVDEEAAYDTLIRGDILNVLSNKFAGCEWPINDDGQAAFDEFLLKYIAGAEEAGFPIRKM